MQIDTSRQVLTVSIHSGVEALGQAARPALVPVSLVHDAGTTSLALAGILATSSHRSLEESCTAVAGEDAVVFARGVVLAHLAWDVVQDATWNKDLLEKPPTLEHKCTI